MTMPPPEPPTPSPPQRLRRVRAVVIGACVVALVAVVTATVVKSPGSVGQGTSSTVSGTLPIGTFSHHPVVIHLHVHQASYLGAFAKGVPTSYAPFEAVVATTGVHPNVALYYSGWREKFQSAFAIHVADHGGIPFIQIDPVGASFAAISAGAYDTYLETFATAVASYGAKTHSGVIIGFGHEMNGQWFPWGYRHLSPALFIAAWRHIVNVFRQQGADDVAWLWTVNIIAKPSIPSPTPWWPGGAYVTWIGIDGYYYKRSWTFASLFGPTIKAVHALTLDPILISETGASPAVGQPRKIANLFAGIRNYGLLGFVWFDSYHKEDWRITTPAAIAAFQQGAKTFDEPTS
jgi:mannan endo-1,4-beta-mannosidase